MNHKNVTLPIAAIVTAAVVVMTAIAFAIPQQALAHYGHHSHNGNSIKVDQNTTQVNLCDHALCANQADNSADIDR
jgi:predicted metal-binding membrane protein